MLQVPPKVVSILVVVQVAAIVGACLTLRTAHRLYVSITTEHGWESIARPWEWPAQTLLFPLPWLLLATLVWGLFALSRANLEGGVATLSRTHSLLGYTVTALVTAFCLNSMLIALNLAVNPYPNRPLTPISANSTPSPLFSRVDVGFSR